MFDITKFFSVKIALAALKVVYLAPYRIFFNSLLYGRPVERKNQDPERTGTIALMGSQVIFKLQRPIFTS